MYTLRKVRTIRGCLEVLALMIRRSRMILTSPGPLLTPPPNSTPLWEPDPALASRPQQQQTGAGHGRPERDPGRHRRAETPQSHRNCVETV